MKFKIGDVIRCQYAGPWWCYAGNLNEEQHIQPGPALGEVYIVAYVSMLDDGAGIKKEYITLRTTKFNTSFYADKFRLLDQIELMQWHCHDKAPIPADDSVLIDENPGQGACGISWSPDHLTLHQMLELDRLRKIPDREDRGNLLRAYDRWIRGFGDGNWDWENDV